MAESKESVIIEVDIDAKNVAQELSRVTYQMATLKEQQKNLKKEIDAGNDATGEMSKQYAQVDKELKLLTASQKALTGQLQNTTEAEHQMGDSFREMDAQLRDLENQYKSLTKVQRESAEGQQLKEQIISLKQELKDFDAELGNHQRNVGNYSEAIVDAAGQMGGLGGAIVGATDKMNKAKAVMTIIAAHPIIAILSGLVLILKTIHDAFAANAAAMEKLTGVMGAFSGAANIVNVIVDKIAVHIGIIAEKALALADRLGLLNDDMKESIRIAKEDLAIQEAERDAALQTAEDQKRIAELKAQAQEKDRYSAKERLAMMQEAADLEESIAKRQYELAKRAYEQQVAKDSLSESSQADLKKENDLRIAMINAETALFNKRKELNGQMVALRAEENARAKADADERRKIADEQAAKLQAIRDEIRRHAQSDEENAIEDLKKQMAQELEVEGLTGEEKLKIEKYYEDQIAKVREAAAKTRKEKDDQELAERKAKEKEASDFLKQYQEEDLSEKYDAQLAQLEEYHKQGLIETEEYEAAKAEIEQRYAQEKAANQAAQAQEYLSALTQLNSAIAGIEKASLENYENGQKERKAALEKRLKSGELSEEKYAKEIEQIDEETERKKIEMEREQAKREKALGILNAGISTAVAIIKMLADPGGPAGIALSALAGLTGAAQIATIAATPLPQFEHGGTIQGNSYTGDHVLIRANSGEGVYTGKQANNLLQRIANSPLTGDANYEPMAAAMAAAVAQQPAPVVVYSELQEFGDKVTTYDEIAGI